MLHRLSAEPVWFALGANKQIIQIAMIVSLL